MRYPTALDLMKARRSIREFTRDPVPRDAIEAIVQAWIRSWPEPLRSRLLGLPGLKREKDYLTICSACRTRNGSRPSCP